MEWMTFVLLLLLAGIVVFQLALALGAPLGKFAWGGSHKGVLPANYRISSVFSILLLVFFGTIIAQQAGLIAWYPAWLSQAVMWAIVVYFALAVVMNGISRSKPERLWAPYSFVMLLLAIQLL